MKQKKIKPISKSEEIKGKEADRIIKDFKKYSLTKKEQEREEKLSIKFLNRFSKRSK